MKHILLFGAGKSATALIHYFLEKAAAESWRLTVVDARLETVKEKLGDTMHGAAMAFDITDAEKRRAVIATADIVISLLPPALHSLVAHDCVAARKNLLTASYVDDEIKALQPHIKSAGLLFLCEMGLDPGIDHMSAKKLIDAIHADGGAITSFHSHCGGLVAPESDDNPWHYKISWNPRNVVMAGKAGAVYKKDGVIVTENYKELFAQKRYTAIPQADDLCWYPNRNSLPYIPLYGLETAGTFVRTTLRHADFIYGWQNVIDLKLTSEEKAYETDGKTLSHFFKEHMERNGFSQWLYDRMQQQFESTKNLLSELMNLARLEEEAAEKGIRQVEQLMMVNTEGSLQEMDVETVKLNAAATVADKMHEANLNLKQLFFLGLNDDETIIDKGLCSAADVLQFALEKKLMLEPKDKDRVVMLHEIAYTKEGHDFIATSSFVLDGTDNINTAMAKTVGLPLAIATKLMLQKAITLAGLHIPTLPEIYEPVLKELKEQGIIFTETIIMVK